VPQELNIGVNEFGNVTKVFAAQLKNLVRNVLVLCAKVFDERGGHKHMVRYSRIFPRPFEHRPRRSDAFGPAQKPHVLNVAE